jgi:hypothetical protein
LAQELLVRGASRTDVDEQEISVRRNVSDAHVIEAAHSLVRPERLIAALSGT